MERLQHSMWGIFKLFIAKHLSVSGVCADEGFHYVFNNLEWHFIPTSGRFRTHWWCFLIDGFDYLMLLYEHWWHTWCTYCPEPHHQLPDKFWIQVLNVLVNMYMLLLVPIICDRDRGRQGVGDQLNLMPSDVKVSLVTFIFIFFAYKMASVL